MKRVLLLFLSSLCFAGEITPSVQLPEGYRLVWHDEFSGTSLDAAKWKALVRKRGDAYNGPEAIRVSDGLKVTTYTDSAGNHTGFLSTESIFQTTFGLFEASIDFHDSPGEWCAFWIQSPTNGKPLGDPERAGMEIDITEHRAVNQTGISIQNSSAMGALHWDENVPSHQDVASMPISPANGKSPQGNFHTYGVLWTPNGYEFYLDGAQVASHPASSSPVSRASEFIYLSCEVHDKSWAGSVPAGGYGNLSSSQTGMDVSWVRVWQK